MLKFSETRRMRLFLNNERSSLEIPGPMTILRPELPNRFAQLFGVVVLGKGSQEAAKEAGAVVTVKQLVLR